MDQLHDFIGAFLRSIAVARRREKGWVGDRCAAMCDALFLSAESWAGSGYAIREADDTKRGFDMASAIGFRELGEQKRALAFWKAVRTGMSCTSER